MPYPHSHTIAKRMGVSPRTVQRSLSWLSKNEFLAKMPKKRRTDRQAFDPGPLVKKLTPYALERIKLIQAKDYSNVLSDFELSFGPRPSAQQMFKDVSKSLADKL